MLFSNEQQHQTEYQKLAELLHISPSYTMTTVFFKEFQVHSHLIEGKRNVSFATMQINAAPGSKHNQQRFPLIPNLSKSVQLPVTWISGREKVKVTLNKTDNEY